MPQTRADIAVIMYVAGIFGENGMSSADAVLHAYMERRFRWGLGANFLLDGSCASIASHLVMPPTCRVVTYLSRQCIERRIWETPLMIRSGG
jgi:hypothetical protein